MLQECQGNVAAMPGSRMLLGPNRNGMGLSLVLGGDAIEIGCYWDVIRILLGCYRDVIGMF